MPHPLGLEAATVLGLDPVRQVALARDLGCAAISIVLDTANLASNPHGYPAWSLREDAPLRRELKAALADTGIIAACASEIALADAQSAERDLDILAELGVWRLGVADMGLERAHALDLLALLTQLADGRGITVCIAFSPIYTIRNLAEALQAVQHAGADRAAVLIDTMHFFRSAGAVRQIADLDPALIGHVRLSDASRRGEGAYISEIATGRMIPGQGELPLREFVDALPRGQLLGLEVPLAAAAANGRAMPDYIGEIVRRTRDFLT